MVDPSQMRVHSAPSWVELAQPDLAAGQAFYGELFGWTFGPAPAGLGYHYLQTLLDGGVAGGMTARPGPARWRIYVTVDDVHVVMHAVARAGGRVVQRVRESDVGRWTVIADPKGAQLGLWEPRLISGVQMVDAPGAWTCNVLHTVVPSAAVDWYAILLGWVDDPVRGATLLRLPSPARRSDSSPQLACRGMVPAQLSGAVAWICAGIGPSRWLATFAVEDRAATTTTAIALGGSLVRYSDYRWARTSIIRDPQGALFAICEYATPPSRLPTDSGLGEPAPG